MWRPLNGAPQGLEIKAIPSKCFIEYLDPLSSKFWMPSRIARSSGAFQDVKTESGKAPSEIGFAGLEHFVEVRFPTP